MKLKQIFQPRGRRAMLGYALAAITLAGSLYYNRGEKLLLLLGFMTAAAFAASGAIKLPERGRLSRVAEPVWYFAAFFAMVIAAQVSQNHAVNGMGAGRIPLNMMSAALPFLLLTLITARPMLSFQLDWALMLALVLVHYAVFMFRGTEFIPADIFSARTAFNVVGSYHLPLYGYFFVSMCLYLLVLFSSFCLPRRKAHPLRTRALSAILGALVLCYWFPVCYNMKLQYFSNLDTIHKGMFASFSAKVIDSFKDQTPEGYSPERVAELEERYRGARAGEGEAADGAPDVIVIMNESFVDLSVLGSEPNTEEELLPFFKELQENSIHGYALTSAMGGGTVQSEYAFLSGNALEKELQRSSVYTVYFHDPVHSLVEEMERQGYATYATHPCLASGYSRSKAYPLLGFDDITFVDDYPQQDIIRENVSDREMYDYVIQKYENKAPGEKFFLFGISMQNHGGYDYVGPDAPFEKLEGYSAEFPLAEQYLGLLQMSDRALKELVDYFEGVDSPVVLLFFGDHVPRIESRFFEELHGKSFDTLDEQELTYQVPFAVWANYDIGARDLGLIGVNYLSNYLYEAAGLELPPYNRFLQDMAEVIPAMNALGYYSRSAGKFLPYDEAEGEEARWLSDYDILQYNSLFDGKNRSELFFPAPEVAPG